MGAVETPAREKSATRPREKRQKILIYETKNFNNKNLIKNNVCLRLQLYISNSLGLFEALKQL